MLNIIIYDLVNKFYRYIITITYRYCNVFTSHNTSLELIYLTRVV